jgi:alkaline phosphatase
MTTWPRSPVPMRERVRVYERAGFPNYPAADAEGYPARVDVSRRLALFSASLPDHYETFRPKLDNPNEPTVAGKDAGTYVANERYKNVLAWAWFGGRRQPEADRGRSGSAVSLATTT